MQKHLTYQLKFGFPFTELDSGAERNLFDGDGEGNDGDGKHFVGVAGFYLLSRVYKENYSLQI